MSRWPPLNKILWGRLRAGIEVLPPCCPLLKGLTDFFRGLNAIPDYQFMLLAGNLSDQDAPIQSVI